MHHSVALINMLFQDTLEEISNYIRIQENILYVSEVFSAKVEGKLTVGAGVQPQWIQGNSKRGRRQRLRN